MKKYSFQHTNISLFIILVFLDQFSKFLIRLRQPADGGFYICNPNIAWGIKIDPFLFWIFWLLVIFFLLLALNRKYFIHYTLCFILIFAGAVSNMVDRLHYGCVTDFINLRFWPAFNLADAFITIGGIMLILAILKMRYKK